MPTPHRIWTVFCCLLAAALAPGRAKAEGDTLPDALHAKNQALLPKFQGTALNGLTGLVIMPTGSALDEHQGRFSIVSYTLQDRPMTFNFPLAGTNPGAITQSARIKTAVLMPIATIRAGNKTEIAIGKQFENSEFAPAFAGSEQFDSTHSEVFAIKQIHVLSRKKAMYLTVAAQSRTARVTPGETYREKTGFLVVSQKSERYELSGGYRFSKEDVNTALLDTHPSKRHQWGLGLEYLLSDNTTFIGEYWTNPGDGGDDDSESAFGIRYRAGEHVMVQGGILDLQSADSEFYASLSYLTEFGGKKPAEAAPAASGDAPAATP